MALQQSPLVKTLGNAEGFDLDLGLFLLHLHKMMVLCSPLFKLQCLLQRLRAWETSGVTVFILISANATCAFFPPGYYMSLVLGLISIMATMGIAHRRTGCLAKVFPSANIKMEDLGTTEGPLSHEEIMLYYKITLFKINRCIQQFNDKMSFVYSILKWDALFPSVRFYTCLFLLAISLHVFPLRCTIVMIVNVFLLEGKISKIIYEYTKKYFKADQQEAENGEDCISQISQESLMTRNFGSQMSDSDSELSDKPDSSSGENSDSETQSVQDISKSKLAKARSAGVVGKIMEFKKKHQGGAGAGSCVSCNVSFSSILKRKHICSHCGNHFCSRCCARKVPRSMFGATAPAAQTETVPVCNFCYMYLTGQKV